MLPTLLELYQEFAFFPLHCAGVHVGLTDKGTTHSYIEAYEELFAPYRHQEISLLEIGIERGASLLLWAKYFEGSRITGIDLNPKLILPEVCIHPHIQLVFADATQEIDNLSTYDIIIDDGSHHVEDQLQTFNLLYSRLNSGGIYVIEDVNSDGSIQELRNKLPNCEVLDRRHVKGRFDDVLVVVRKS